MLALVSLSFSILFTLTCRNALRKFPVGFYAGTAIISLIGIIIAWSGVTMPGILRNLIIPMIIRGGLSGALFLIIMWIGALPNGSAPMKWLMPIRGELSIIASVLTLGHNIAYGKTYFVLLFTRPDSLPVSRLLAAVCSLIMIAVMLPLFLTSFRKVRRKMNIKTWRKLQKWAYLFYFLMFVHVLLLNVPGALRGQSESLFNVFVYCAVFGSYLICRIMKMKYLNRQVSGIVSAVLISAAVTLLMRTYSCPPYVFSDVSADSSHDSITERTGAYRDGTYAASAMGMNGPINVEVTIQDNHICSIDITEHHDDPAYFSDALEVIDLILDTGSTDVDTVSGATWSSEGIIKAVEQALAQAESAGAE